MHIREINTNTNLCTIYIIVKLWFGDCDKNKPEQKLTLRTPQIALNFLRKDLRFLYVSPFCSHNVTKRGENSLHIYTALKFSQLI